MDCSSGEACNSGTCEVSFEASYNFRDSGKYDSSKMLTYEECETFAENSELAADTSVYSAGGGKPAGCMVDSSGWVRWQLEDRADCSESYNCIEWIDPPIDDCDTGVIVRGCTCGSVTCGHGGTCENDVCIVPLIGRIELRTENAVDMGRALTESECQDIYDLDELGHTMIIESNAVHPYGCQLHSYGYMYYNSFVSNIDCSTDYDCIEWKAEHVPVNECGNTDGSVAVLRKCTCGTSVAEVGQYCDGTVVLDQSFDDLYNIRSSGASDLSKVLTQDECTVFSTNSARASDSDMVVIQWNDRPRGCYMRRDNPYIYYNDVLTSSGDPCGSGDTYSTMDCIEWVDPPVEQCIDGSFNLRACVCGSPKAVAVTYDSETYDICNGDTATVTWNGYHNIQEVTEDGYTQYATATAEDKPSYHIGEAIHGYEDDGHSEVIDGLQALGRETRYFICTTHPASKFSVECLAGCLSAMDCDGGVCTYPECTNTDGTELMAACECNGEIENKYCHGTYSSDKPSCTGDTRPCSCTETLDCQTDEYCTAGACSSAFTQTITVPAGKWTWISVGVTPSDDSINSLFPVAAAEDKIQSQEDGTTTRKDYSQWGGPVMWEGRLSEIPQYQMLKVNFASETILSVTGDPTNEMTISTGWKWFGIPAGDDIPIDDLFSGEWEEGDKIQSQEDGTTTRKDYSQWGGPVMWEGRLTKLVPGVGYKINKQTGGTYTVR